MISIDVFLQKNSAVMLVQGLYVAISVRGVQAVANTAPAVNPLSKEKTIIVPEDVIIISLLMDG